MWQKNYDRERERDDEMKNADARFLFIRFGLKSAIFAKMNVCVLFTNWFIVIFFYFGAVFNFDLNLKKHFFTVFLVFFILKISRGMNISCSIVISVFLHVNKKSPYQTAS